MHFKDLLIEENAWEIDHVSRLNQGMIKKCKGKFSKELKEH